MVEAGHRTDLEVLTGGEVQCDVAAVVDVSAGEPPARQHRIQHRIGDGAGDGGHRRDEHARVPRRGADHARRDRTGDFRQVRADRPTQDRQVADEEIEQRFEIADSLLIGRFHLARLPPGLDDQIDRPVLQVQPPAVRQHAG